MNSEINQKKWLEKVENTITLGGKSKSTYENYRCHINRFLNNYDSKVNIKDLKEDDMIDYFLDKYIKLNKTTSTLNVAICSIRYFYLVNFNITLNKNLLPWCKTTKKTPVILQKEDFLKLINDNIDIKYKCWLILAFASGLRAAEVSTIRIENIFPKEHKIKVLGKNKKERYTLLPDITIKLLRHFCKEYRITKKEGYLFKGTSGKEHLSSNTIINYFTLFKRKHNLSEDISFHSLRHSFATYFLMNGGNINTLKSMLGHKSLAATGIYLHTSQNFNKLEGVKYD